MGAWEQRRVADAAALLKDLIVQGGRTGVHQTRGSQAGRLGWGIGRIDVILRCIRENPQWGYAIAISRGSDPWWVVSTPKDTIQGKAITDELNIQYDSFLMYLWQIARAESTEFVHWTNIDANAKGTPERKKAQQQRNEHRKRLIAIQLFLQPMKRSREAELDEFINDVLAV
jgi:hypothetical protein